MSSSPEPPPPPTGSLRPLLLPKPPAWSHLHQLKQQLVHLDQQRDQYNKVALKLDTITDEPTWEALIPFGPLAYFSGQLIHTNDITQTLPTTPLDSTTPAVEGGGQEEDWEQGDSWKILKSAKQARESVRKQSAEVEEKRLALEKEIEKQEKEVRKVQASQLVGGSAGEEDWSFNEAGEVINEEGLPMFDIHEELPAELEVPVVEEEKKEKEPEMPKQQMRYLIKKGGKQVVRPLNVPSASTPAVSPVSVPKAPPAVVRVPPPPAASRPSGPVLDTKSILDQLEQEEAEEEAKRLVEEGPKVVELEKEDEKPVVVVTDPTPSPPPSGPSATVPPTKSKVVEQKSSTSAPLKSPAPPTKDFLPSFSSGFLSRKPKPTPPSTTIAPSPLPPPLPTTASPPTSPHHSPLHHSMTPLAPALSRPSSPRPSTPTANRKVAFNLPTNVPAPGETVPKPKRAAIPLPPPPSHDEEEPKKPEKKEKEKFIRPMKELVVERPIKPPSEPKPTPRIARPITVPSNSRPPPPPPPSSSSTAEEVGPIHTINLSSSTSSKNKINGHASIHEIIPDSPASDGDEEEEEDIPPTQPSLTSDGDSSSSDGFYASDDDEEEEEEEELDIDAALHAREVALAYHQRRMGLGAGAGTGPLGGGRDPESWDSWDQPNVPLEATLQGRTPTSSDSRSSRFRTGRLESAQMIIPDLLASHVRSERAPPSDSEEEGEDEDGLTKEERRNIRETLKALEGYEGGPLPVEKLMREREERERERRKEGERRPPSVVASGSGGDKKVEEKEKEEMKLPDVVERSSFVATPLVVEGKEEVKGTEEGVKPKKMSRFKARQLGLE